MPASRSGRALARRLLDAGLAHPDVQHEDVPVASDVRAARDVSAARDVTVVIPVRDRARQLARCLAALTGPGRPPDVPDVPAAPAALPVVVADDGSADADGIAAVTAAAGARLVRRPVTGGPGAARNSGAAVCDTPFIAFVDSDCVPRPGWLEALLPHFADPAVGAVAPRIVSHEPPRTWLGRYEAVDSSLDRGPRESLVAPGTRVPYVPTATLVVRRDAIGAGFAEDIMAGEDVDFVWRLAAAGWRVRYEPRSQVGHEHRTRLRPWFSRRRHYGTSAAVLESRHPGTVRPLYVSRWTAAAWITALAGYPVAAGAVVTAVTVLLARRISSLADSPSAPSGVARGPDAGVPSGAARGPDAAPSGVARRADVAPSGAACCADAVPSAGACPAVLPSMTTLRLAGRLAAGGTVAAGRPIGSAISRAWWPVAVPAAIAVRRLRLPLAALVLAPPILDWLDRRPPVSPAHYVAGRLAGDFAYSIGLWEGCTRHRDFRALLPAAKRKARHSLFLARVT